MSVISVVFPDTGDYLELSDPRDAANQATWKRATPAAIEMTRNPGEMAGEKLASIVGVRSSLGDPRKPGFIKGLRPGQRAVALEQLAQAAASWHLQQGRNADGSANPSVEGVVTMTAQGQAIISRPATKAATAAALRLAAQDAGPQRGELLAKAAVAEQEAEREAADLAKAAAATRRRAPSRRRTWGDMVLAGSIKIGPTPSDAARARAKAAAANKAAAAADDLPGAPDMLFKAGRAG